MSAAPGADDRTAALLIRVWIEPSAPHAPRARLLSVEDADEPGTWSTAVGDATIGAEVLRWLRTVRAPAPSAATRRSARPLVDPAWVEEHLDDPGVVLVEVDDERCRYAEGHLPGAVRLDWAADLHSPVRRAFVDAEGLAALLDARGISADAHVVLYGDRGNTLAASAYWYLAYHGHARLSLLDGGRTAWLAEGRPITADPPSRSPTSGYVPGSGRPEILATRDAILAGLVGAPPGVTLLDCRRPDEYAGRACEPYDVPIGRHRVTGHIPGAVSLPVEELVDARTERLVPVPRLRELCERRGVRPDDSVVVYCGVSDRAALVWFALHEVLGWPSVRFYYGAWAEYGSLADVPVDPGDGGRRHRGVTAP